MIYDKREPYSRRRAYACAKAQAKYRGEPWNFTMESWLKIWDDAGAWDSKGSNLGKLCMSRRDLTLPWEPANVDLVTRSESSRRHR